MFEVFQLIAVVGFFGAMIVGEIAAVVAIIEKEH